MAIRIKRYAVKSTDIIHKGDVCYRYHEYDADTCQHKIFVCEAGDHIINIQGVAVNDSRPDIDNPSQHIVDIRLAYHIDAPVMNETLEAIRLEVLGRERYQWR